MNRCSEPITILLADDHSIVREGLRLILEAEPLTEVVDEAATGSEAVDKVRQHTPDLVLMDITMPHMNGLEATRRIKELAPGVHVLMLTVHKSVEYAVESVHAGASGYLVKETARTELMNAIHTVLEESRFICPMLPEQTLEKHLRRAAEVDGYCRYKLLTPREREVCQLLAEDRTNHEIAALLGVSIKTVETHRSNLMAKLQLTSLTELVKFAISRGIVEGHVDDSL